jgi:hypothetical protein
MHNPNAKDMTQPDPLTSEWKKLGWQESPKSGNRFRGGCSFSTRAMLAFLVIITIVLMGKIDRMERKLIDIEKLITVVKPFPLPPSPAPAVDPRMNASVSQAPKIVLGFPDDTGATAFGFLENGQLAIVKNYSPKEYRRFFWREIDKVPATQLKDGKLTLNLGSFWLEVDTAQRKVRLLPETMTFPPDLTKFWQDISR